MPFAKSSWTSLQRIGKKKKKHKIKWIWELSSSLYFKCQPYKVSWGVAQTKYPTPINLSALWTLLMPCHSIRRLKGCGASYLQCSLPASCCCYWWTQHRLSRLGLWAQFQSPARYLHASATRMFISLSKYVIRTQVMGLFVLLVALWEALWMTCGIKTANVGGC